MTNGSIRFGKWNLTPGQALTLLRLQTGPVLLEEVDSRTSARFEREELADVGSFEMTANDRTHEVAKLIAASGRFVTPVASAQASPAPTVPQPKTAAPASAVVHRRGAGSPSTVPPVAAPGFSAVDLHALRAHLIARHEYDLATIDRAIAIASEHEGAMHGSNGR